MALLPANTRIWVLSDGKAGDEMQCLGVADYLGKPEIKRVAPRALFSWLMPWGPVDPREAPGRPGSPLTPPWPDLVIASGRRSVASLRALKRASAGRVFTVFLKDPRIGTQAADLIWVPEHDALRGQNVIVTLTSPHRISPERLHLSGKEAPAALLSLKEPRAAVLIGGDSRHHRFTPQDIERFCEALLHLANSGSRLMGTLSRRTPPNLAEAVAHVFAGTGGFLHKPGEGENPYLSLLALAETVIVTADSVNMIGEAAATGRPVLVFSPSGGHRKIDAFIAGLKQQGIVHDFVGRLAGEPYAPLDATPDIAHAIAKAYMAFRARTGSSP